MSFDLGLSGRRVLVTEAPRASAPPWSGLCGRPARESRRRPGRLGATDSRMCDTWRQTDTTAEGCAIAARSALDHLGGIDIVTEAAHSVGLMTFPPTMSLARMWRCVRRWRQDVDDAG